MPGNWLGLLNVISVRHHGSSGIFMAGRRKLTSIRCCCSHRDLAKNVDDAIRVELCPAGYKLIEYPRTRRCGGGIGLLYKDSLRVTKVRNGEEESFEYCELLVQISSSLKIRVVIVYRPPHSEDHRVPVVTFLSEFSSYMESIILSIKGSSTHSWVL